MQSSSVHEEDAKHVNDSPSAQQSTGAASSSSSNENGVASPVASSLEAKSEIESQASIAPEAVSNASESSQTLGQNEPQYASTDSSNTKEHVASSPIPNTPQDTSRSVLTKASSITQGADAVPATEQSAASPAQSNPMVMTPKTDGAVLSEEGQTIEIQSAPLPPIPDTLPPTPVSKSLNSPYGVASTPPRPSSVLGQRPTSAHHRSLTMSQGGKTLSVVLISSALETISASKEAKRSAPLRDSTARALEMIKAGNGGDQPREIFEPLRLACETRSEKLMIASLDCIAKLISYSFFAESVLHPYNSPPPSPGPRSSTASATSSSNTSIPLADLVVQTITSCHTESTAETVSLQIVKALLAIVLSPTIFVHHSSLLKAVRTVYNVFLLSADPVNQTVAQGGLTQMVHHVFTRCQTAPEDDDSHHHTADSSSTMIISLTHPEKSTRSPSSRGSLTLPTNGSTSSLPTQENTEATNGEAHQEPEKASTEATEATDAEQRPALQTLETVDTALDPEPLPLNHSFTKKDLFIKDAFLVFRALCKLTMKPLNTESERDLKSHAMRSKLLSLHLVLTVLNSHMPLFLNPTAVIYSSSSNEPTTFIQASNQYICLTLSRNAVSPVPQVFETSVEIFWRVLAGMRTKLKKEIEVLLHEIFIPILEMRTSTLKQKAVVLGLFSRLCQDPQALVEIYLNYDCDSSAVDNIYEHLMNIMSKIGTLPYAPTQPKQAEPMSPSVGPNSKTQNANLPPPLNTNTLSVSGSMDTSHIGLSEQQLRRQGLECFVAVLKSLVAWGTTTGKSAADGTGDRSSVVNERRDTLVSDGSSERLSMANGSAELLRQSTPELADDPSRFETAKQKKTTLLEGIKKFNFKPKKGVQFLLEAGFIPSKNPKDIARFLLSTDGLNKTVLGEYLGEGDEANIAIMHAFVDELDLQHQTFLDALRNFLQAFRLPGEAQKIDRFMLKFAERYIAGNPGNVFANADAAYVLAYSTILLNTDAHNAQVKRRMTKTDFIRNNRGINDGADLPEDFLESIYDDIVHNEIRMKDEIEPVVVNTNAGLAGALANVGRDPQKEAYVLQSNGMANKTEALFRTLMRSQRRGSKAGDQFFSASHFVHVKPMFEVAWIPFLAGLSGPLQDTDDLEIVELCLDGFKSAIHITCFFDLELERNAFVTTLAKFTFLNNLGEMKTKNMEAIKSLLDIAVTEGNHLKGSWREVLTCVSQLERMQLISSGVEVADAKKIRTRKGPNEALANESRSTHITVAADMVFSLSHYLSGDAIVDFVQALSDVSWEEIQSSGMSQHPRLFSLQKLVEISYYNMNRIRLEWSNLWEILGEHFNQVCCHNNPHVGFFALDSLRQLAMRFLEKEELPHFKFQKDFLKPFEYTMIHNQNPDIRDMVLQCLQQMIQARVQNMRSGWRTMFGVFSAGAKVPTERIASSAFEIITRLNREHFASIVRYGAFADLTVCITEFCKVSKYQKISLLAIGMLRGIISQMLACSECSLSSNADHSEDGMIKYWYPILFSFYDIIMNGEDIEVRTLALNSLFSTLKTYGSTYAVNFWDTVCQELLFPIFAVLKSSQDVSRFNTQEDMSVWLSTTMIQALRDLIDLYTYFFDILDRFMDGLLDLLCVCICQENDTLARIGTSCLQQLIESNVSKFTPSRWENVVTTFLKLFRATTPHQLFDDGLRIEIDDNAPEPTDTKEPSDSAIIPAPLSPGHEHGRTSAATSLAERRRIFKQIIVKCVLQLLLIETTNDLLRHDEVYTTIPPEQLLRLMGVLDHSYQFARHFNEDKELRTGLWKVGFMKHLPNLLKQESSSASTLVHILLRMYFDPRPEHQSTLPQISERLLPLSLSVLQDYTKLRPDVHVKNITAWTPVVVEILEGLGRFDDNAFSMYLPAVYPLATELLVRDLAPEIRVGLKVYFERVGWLQGITDRP